MGAIECVLLEVSISIDVFKKDPGPPIKLREPFLQPPKVLG